MATAMTSLTAAIASTSSKQIDPAHPDLTAPQDRLDEDGDVFQVRLPAQVGSDGFEIGPLRASNSRRSKSARRVSGRYAVRRTCPAAYGTTRLLGPPLTRSGPGPSPEGMVESADFGVAQKEGYLRKT